MDFLIGWFVCLFLPKAGGAVDTQRRGTQPGTAEDPQGDGVQEDQGAGLRGLRHRLQGIHPHSITVPTTISAIALAATNKERAFVKLEHSIEH